MNIDENVKIKTKKIICKDRYNGWMGGFEEEKPVLRAVEKRFIKLIKATINTEKPWLNVIHAVPTTHGS
jgi:hypothetical protein